MVETTTIRAKVMYPVWVEIQVDDEILEAIACDDPETLENLRAELIDAAGYYMETSTVEPEIDCDVSQLSDVKSCSDCGEVLHKNHETGGWKCICGLEYDS